MVLDFYEIAFRIGFIYIFIIIGSFLRYLSKDPDNSIYIKYLTKLILNLLFPFLVISAIINVTGDSFQTIFLSIFFCLVVIFAGMGSVLLYSHFKSIEKSTLGSMLLAVSFPNSIFLPFPLILTLIGPSGLLSATLFAVTIIIIQNTIGSYIGLSYGSSTDNQVAFKITPVLKKVLFFPPALSMIIGFLLKITFRPNSFADLFSFTFFSTSQVNFAINTANWVSLIFALLLVGLTFNFSVSSLRTRTLPITSFFRLIIAPFSAIFCMACIYTVFPLPEIIKPEFIIPLLIQAFSGPAIINIAFAREFSLDIESESVYITMVTLFSLILLPFLVIFFFTIFF